MPAPDLPPPLVSRPVQRPLAVHLHVRYADPEHVRGAVVIVIDALRASVTITAAVQSGAACVIPQLTVEEARLTAAARRTRGERVVLGGERGGARIEGFDLGNTPTDYTPERVRGASVVLTTTNGTAALLHARQAGQILVGSFANLSAVCRHVAHDPRPVHIVCCGTRDEISLDDVLPAGAMVEALTASGREVIGEDSARVARLAWKGAQGELERAMLDSRGGRNLIAQGLSEDVRFCARIDTLGVVPVFDAARSEIRGA